MSAVDVEWKERAMGRSGSVLEASWGQRGALLGGTLEARPLYTVVGNRRRSATYVSALLARTLCHLCVHIRRPGVSCTKGV